MAVRGGFKTKNGDERATAADGYVFSSRASRPGVGATLDREYLNKRFKHYAALAGISPDHTFHSLRRTFASWLAADGVDMFRIQKLMDHKDIRTTIRSYAYLSPQSARTDVRRVFGKQKGGMIWRRMVAARRKDGLTSRRRKK